jgi:hypothetical protein
MIFLRNNWRGLCVVAYRISRSPISPILRAAKTGEQQPVRFGSVPPQVQAGGQLIELAKPDEERLIEAQETFRRLGSEVHAFAHAEFLAYRVVTVWL